jgi:hypothetical protein
MTLVLSKLLASSSFAIAGALTSISLEIMRDANFMREIRKGIQCLKRTKKHYSLDELFAD